MERHPEVFGSDFDQNKKALEDLAVVPSKQLRNRIAGYIAKMNREEPPEGNEPPAEEPKE